MESSEITYQVITADLVNYKNRYNHELREIFGGKLPEAIWADDQATHKTEGQAKHTAFQNADDHAAFAAIDLDSSWIP